MSDNVEVCLIASELCSGYCGCTDKFAIRDIAGCGSQVRRRDSEKVGLQFGFTIFLPEDCSVFCDDSSVIIACIATRMSKIAPECQSISLDQHREYDALPIGSPIGLYFVRQSYSSIRLALTNHVDIENCDSKTVVVLVEHSLKLFIQ